MRRSILLGFCLVLVALPGWAETLRVGPAERFRTPSEAAGQARAGDRILITPGRYVDCATWRAPDLTIEAAPGGPVEITGPVCGDKALFVVAAPRLTIIGLTFLGARAPSGNGAGIRAEGGDLRIVRTTFRDNENGILTRWDGHEAELVIEDSLFVGNGALINLCAHGIYVGDWRLVSIRRTRFEATRICHHVKSRARRTEVIDSWILDAPPGRASYLVDIPNGGDLLLRNTVLRKGPEVGNPTAAVVIGAEGVRNPTTSLVIRDNWFENLQTLATVFVRNLSTTPAMLEGNRLSGQVTPLEGPGELR
jgi:hypothetical protein